MFLNYNKFFAQQNKLLLNLSTVSGFSPSAGVIFLILLTVFPLGAITFTFCKYEAPVVSDSEVEGYGCTQCNFTANDETGSPIVQGDEFAEWCKKNCKQEDKQMAKYTVSVTLTVEAQNKDEAWAEAEHKLHHKDYDHDSIDVELEEKDVDS